MNDNDLERDLRSQRGPREEGYTPAVLPMTLEDRATAAPVPSRLGRASLLVAVAAAGALVAAVVAGVLSGPGPGPEVGAGSESPTASESQSATESDPGPGLCGIADVEFSAEPWSGAAGSRGTVVTISLADGRYPCAVAAQVAAQLSDANGSALVSGQSAPILPAPDLLGPGSAVTLAVKWSNWCLEVPAMPVRLSIRLFGWPSAIEVPVPEGPDTAPPPCNDESLPPSLSVTNPQPLP